MPNLNKISEEAKQVIKKNKKLLYNNFTSDNLLKPKDRPVSIFMAGSPGAGKTEYSKRFIQKFAGDIARIDADEIREIIPQYTGANSDIVQGAASIGVDVLFNHVLKKKYNLLLDGTFAKLDIAHRNIERCLNKGREVAICYIYQEPLIAWEFTKKREKIEGRRIPKRAFIESFINSKKNVKKIKEIFKNKVEIYLIIKDYTNNIKEFYFDVYIDSYLKKKYTKDDLKRILKNA